MATSFDVKISMDSNTVSSLKNSGYSLYGFKAVKTSIKGGVPLVWFSNNNFLTTVDVAWTESYQAYISTTQIAPNTKITSSNSAAIDLGQTMTVDNSGNVTVAAGGTPGSISVLNASTTQYSTGMSQQQNGTFNPICAFPLFGQMLDVMMPIEQVLFMFATNQVDTGTVIYRAYSQGMIVDLTGVSSRTISFDINNGWTAGGAWGTPVQANADLLPILIQN